MSWRNRRHSPDIYESLLKPLQKYLTIEPIRFEETQQKCEHENIDNQSVDHAFRAEVEIIFVVIRQLRCSC